jgi:hypothetical protein
MMKFLLSRFFGVGLNTLGRPKVLYRSHVLLNLTYETTKDCCGVFGLHYCWALFLFVCCFRPFFGCLEV